MCHHGERVLNEHQTVIHASSGVCGGAPRGCASSGQAQATQDLARIEHIVQGATATAESSMFVAVTKTESPVTGGAASSAVLALSMMLRTARLFATTGSLATA